MIYSHKLKKIEKPKMEIKIILKSDEPTTACSLKGFLFAKRNIVDPQVVEFKHAL